MEKLNELSIAIHQNSIDKGWYDKDHPVNIGEKLALIHSEVSEALEADRENRYCKESKEVVEHFAKSLDTRNAFRIAYTEKIKGTFEEELADIIIRVLDLAALLNIDIDWHVEAKMTYNSTREKHHGGKKY